MSWGSRRNRSCNVNFNWKIKEPSICLKRRRKMITISWDLREIWWGRRMQWERWRESRNTNMECKANQVMLSRTNKLFKIRHYLNSKGRMLWWRNKTLLKRPSNWDNRKRTNGKYSGIWSNRNKQGLSKKSYSWKNLSWLKRERNNGKIWETSNSTSRNWPKIEFNTPEQTLWTNWRNSSKNVKKKNSTPNNSNKSGGRNKIYKNSRERPGLKKSLGWYMKQMFKNKVGLKKMPKESKTSSMKETDASTNKMFRNNTKSMKTGKLRALSNLREIQNSDPWKTYVSIKLTKCIKSNSIKACSQKNSKGEDRSKLTIGR